MINLPLSLCTSYWFCARGERKGTIRREGNSGDGRMLTLGAHGAHSSGPDAPAH